MPRTIPDLAALTVGARITVRFAGAVVTADVAAPARMLLGVRMVEVRLDNGSLLGVIGADLVDPVLAGSIQPTRPAAPRKRAAAAPDQGGLF